MTSKSASSFIQSVDERTRLAGTNRLEILLFTLGEDRSDGQEEWFGINVFKVREVMHIPEITRAPDMPDSIEGMVCLRGVMVPVINLVLYCNMQTDCKPKILMVTEYNQHIQGFLVHSVECIQRLAWENIKTPPPVIVNRHGGLVTGVVELDDKRLVMIMDVEKVLAEVAGPFDDEGMLEGIESVADKNINVLFADDSSVARRQISATLDRLGVRYVETVNGLEAWKKLKEIADQAEATGKPVSDRIQAILTDVEMPEMDGYVLTKKIKEDPRFNGVPVIMHSSLTADANQTLGMQVGADAYVPKFQAQQLASVLCAALGIGSPTGQLA